MGTPLDKKSPVKLSRNALALRRNLLIVSTLTLTALYFEIEIETFNVLGNKIIGLLKKDIYVIDAILILYLLSHFTVCVISEYKDWRAKLVLIRNPSNMPIGWPDKETPAATFLESFLEYIQKILEGKELQKEAQQSFQHILSYIRGIQNLTLWERIYFFVFEVGIPMLMGMISFSWLLCLIYIAN